MLNIVTVLISTSDVRVIKCLKSINEVSIAIIILK